MRSENFPIEDTSLKKGREMLKKFMLVGLVAVISGCASAPTSDVMKTAISGYQLPKLPDANKAIVYVVRPSSLGGLVRFNVFVDDHAPESEVGYTRSSQYIYFNLSPGQHTLYSKAENWAEIAVEAKANDIIFIQQEPAMGFFISRNNLFKLEDYQGKYQVKTLSVGTIIKTEK
jgi:hypothetical protein